MYTHTIIREEMIWLLPLRKPFDYRLNIKRPFLIHSERFHRIGNKINFFSSPTVQSPMRRTIQIFEYSTRHTKVNTVSSDILPPKESFSRQTPIFWYHLQGACFIRLYNVRVMALLDPISVILLCSLQSLR